MKLYIGGAMQGQNDLAQQENPDAPLFLDFHETIREVLLRGEDVRAFAQDFCVQHPDAVIASNEVGCGVVPIEATERAFREAVGRALCVIAPKCISVTRVVCGIAVRLK